jgi:hypothetical protein
MITILTSMNMMMMMMMATLKLEKTECNFLHQLV